MNTRPRALPGSEDPFTEYDAAYVLGALSPEDRYAFEQHLRGCPACARSVRDMAGMPGLLAQARDTVPAEPPPGHLLPSLLRTVRRRRRRGLAGAVAGAAVAAAAAVAIVLGLALPPSAGQPDGVAMQPVGPYAVPVEAVANVTEADAGSRVDMSCTYRKGNGGDYVLVAVRPDGRVVELARWHAVPDDTVRISVPTDLRDGELQALEIRTTAGKPVLRMGA